MTKLKETKTQKVRRLVSEFASEGNIRHDSNGTLYYYRHSNKKWEKLNEYSMRNELRSWIQRNLGEDELTHTDIEFLRQEIAEEPDFLAEELDFP